MAIFIAVIFVMALMIAFLVVAIAKFKDQIECQIKKDVDRNLNVYDPIIEKKSEKLHEIELEILKKLIEKQTYENSEVSNRLETSTKSVLISDTSSYVNRDFFKDYAKVKNDFHDFAYLSMKKTVEALVREKRDVNVHEFKELLDIFDYELQYQMSTLGFDSQLEVMQLVTNHSMGKKRILQKYISEKGTFNFTEFMNYVRDYIFDHDSIIYVLYNANKETIKNSEKNVIFQLEASIGEGYIIKFRNKIYNFSL